MSFGIPVRNGLGVGLMASTTLASLRSFSPSYLFTSGAQGAWYDPSVFSTLFQNAAGTTPVTAVEQPVRLMLDRSQGLVLGPELIESPYTGATSGTWAVGATSVTRNSSSSGQASVNLSTAISTSKRYQVQFTVSNLSGDTFFYRLGSGGATYQVTANGTYIARVPGGGTSSTIVFAPWSGTAGEATIDNITVKELPGNHALAPNDASRPVLRARYNLLTYSEQFDNAIWTKTRATVTANAGVAPDGTTTADTFTEDSTASNTHFVNGPSSGAPSYTTAATVTASIFVKIASGTRNVAIRTAGNSGSAVAIYNPSTGAFVTSTTTGSNWTFVSSSVTALANGWYRITCTGAHTETSGGLTLFCSLADGTNSSYTGDGTSGILIWGAQLLTAADQTATNGIYQRIAAATDYDVSNQVWRPYLAFDGLDDSFGTSSIDFSATDEMTVFAGLTKLSDAAIATVCLLGTAGSDGYFVLQAPSVNGSPRFQFFAKGTAESNAVVNNAIYAAPNTRVVTTTADISAPQVAMRINGASANTSTATMGTGNFANAALFIGRRNNIDQPYNGRIYSLIVLGRTATATELTATEMWVNGKTGSY